MQRTLVLVKPDGVERGLVGRILARFEEKGLRIAALKMLRLDRRAAEEHYAVHGGKHFYEPLVDFITSGAVVAAVIEGLDAVEVVRRMVGATSCREASAGTVRGDLGMSGRFNLVHAADSPESAREEMARFFSEAELAGPEAPPRAWIYDTSGDGIV